jgi:hypothetical protein
MPPCSSRQAALDGSQLHLDAWTGTAAPRWGLDGCGRAELQPAEEGEWRGGRWQRASGGEALGSRSPPSVARGSVPALIRCVILEVGLAGRRLPLPVRAPSGCTWGECGLGDSARVCDFLGLWWNVGLGPNMCSAHVMCYGLVFSVPSVNREPNRNTGTNVLGSGSFGSGSRFFQFGSRFSVFRAQG